MSYDPNLLNSSDGAHTEVPAMFRIGGNLVVAEYFEHGEHRTDWALSEDDYLLAEIAGWDKFILGDMIGRDDNEIASLVVPVITRNASSVLGGVEAWIDEKRTIINKLSSYASAVHKLYGGIDINASISRMGVVQGNNDSTIFFAPPHRISRNVEEINKWVSMTEKDIEKVLYNDPNMDLLLTYFRANLVRDGLRKAS